MNLKDIDSEGDEKKDRSTQEMSVDIGRFIMKIEETLEGTKTGIWGRPVMGENVLVVFLPWMKLIPSE